MNQERITQRRQKFLLSFGYWAAIALIVYVLFRYFIRLVLPFFIALILAGVSRPMAKWLSKTERMKKTEDGRRVPAKRRVHLPYNAAAVVSVIVTLLLFLLLFSVLLLPIVTTAVRLAGNIPSLYLNTLLPGVLRLINGVKDALDNLSGPAADFVESVTPGILSSLGSAATSLSKSLVGLISSFAGAMPGYLLKGIITLIASLFLAVDWDNLALFLKLNLPGRVWFVASDVKNELVDTVSEFIRSYFVIFLITATEISVGLLLVGIEYAVSYGLLIALFDAFPIVGSGMIMLPWSVITMLTGDLKKGIGLFILYAVVVIARQFLEPKIVGKKVGLRPIFTLFCMYLGNKLFGVLGLFGLPICAAIISGLNGPKYHFFTRVSEAPAGPEAAPEKTGEAKEEETVKEKTE